MFKIKGTLYVSKPNTRRLYETLIIESNLIISECLDVKIMKSASKLSGKKVHYEDWFS